MINKIYIILHVVSLFSLNNQLIYSQINLNSLKHDTLNEISNTKTTDTLFYKEIRNEESLENYSAHIYYVQFDKSYKDLNNLIEALVFDSLGSEKNYVSNSFKEYDEHFKGVAEEDIFHWTDEKGITIEFNSNYLISFIFSNFNWRSGGAIGFGSDKCYMFDIKSNHLVSFDDLIDTRKKRDLEKVLQRCYRTTLPEEEKNKSLKKLGWDSNSITITKNIYIDINGIYFLYNRFEYVPDHLV